MRAGTPRGWLYANAGAGLAQTRPSPARRAASFQIVSETIGTIHAGAGVALAPPRLVHCRPRWKSPPWVFQLAQKLGHCGLPNECITSGDPAADAPTTTALIRASGRVPRTPPRLLHCRGNGKVGTGTYFLLNSGRDGQAPPEEVCASRNSSYVPRCFRRGGYSPHVQALLRRLTRARTGQT